MTFEGDYTNHRGEKRARRLHLLSLRFGATEWHPVPGLLIKAEDLDRPGAIEIFDSSPGAGE